MYCDKCRNNVPDNVRYCDKCGNDLNVFNRPVSVQQPPTPTSALYTPKANSIWLIASLATSIVILIMMLTQKCITIDAFTYFASVDDSSITAFQLFEFAEGLTELSDDFGGALFVCALLIMIANISCIITIAIHVIEVALTLISGKPLSKNKPIFFSCLIFLIVVFISTVFINSGVNESSYGIIDEVVSVNSSVIFTLIIAGVEALFCHMAVSNS